MAIATHRPPHMSHLKAATLALPLGEMLIGLALLIMLI